MSVHLTWAEEIGELFHRRWWPFILLCLADGPKLVQDIRQIINDQVSDPIAEGVLYHQLKDLLNAGLLYRVQWEKPQPPPWALTAAAEPVVRKLRQLKRAVDLVEASELHAGGMMTPHQPPATENPPTTPADREPATRPDWAPPDVDVNRPSVARIYDYYLGGHHNFAADREQAEQSIKLLPETALRARANRAFLGRAVRYLLSAGVRQFLDIGSGIPTVGNVHEIIDKAGIRAPVVYVDIDPVAVAHTRHILAGHPTATVIHEDARHPQAILTHPDVQKWLDLTQPLGLLMVAVLHAIPDADDPANIMRCFRDRLAPGSYLAIAHVTADSQPELRTISDNLSQRTTTPITMRTKAHVQRFLAGFDPVEPGLVWGPQWRPDPGRDPEISPELSWNYVAVARKPGPAPRPLRPGTTRD
jgi:DNA-binding HxlR family transcriptional regulator/SAM-dependent methyltransferase